MKLAPARGEYGHVSDIFAIPENIAGSNFLKVLSVLLPLCKYLMMIQNETLSSRLLVSVAWALSGKDVDGSNVGVCFMAKNHFTENSVWECAWSSCRMHLSVQRYIYF
jgi:hypothetical protein